MDEVRYPDTYFRGISNKDFVVQNRVIAAAFQFDEKIRKDGFKELSINWNDSDDALKTILNQRKTNGKLQFSVGAAKLDLNLTKIVFSPYIDRNEFNYERSPIDGNQFHGNLLIKGTLDKRIRLSLSSTLAFIADVNILYQEDFKIED